MASNKEKLVLRVNELFHDISKNDYDNKTNLDMLAKEADRWARAGNFLQYKKPVLLLDIGTGAGFVPLVICRFLKESDRFICSDISQEMLKLAEKKLKKKKFRCKFRFLKLEKHIPLRDNSIDIVTINSVLHHIPDTEYFLNEVDRVLKKDGIIIIGHEPNVRFARNKKLVYVNHLFSLIFTPKQALKFISVKLGIFDILHQLSGFVNGKRRRLIDDRDIVAKNISEILKKENLIKRELSIGEIMSLVDYKTSGFDPFNLISGYKILHIETYHHMRAFEYANKKFFKKYSEKLKEKYPLDGRTFFCILKK